MSPHEIAKIKADLLCYGVQMSDDARKNGESYNSYLLDGGFVHAAHFMIGDVVVNTCVEEAFCKESPYIIDWKDNGFALMKEGSFMCEIDIIRMPEWCLEEVNGHKIADYLRPHSLNCVSCCPKLKCAYYTNEEQCGFCSIGDYAKINKIAPVLEPPVVAKMIKRAIKANPNYEIALSGGTCDSEDKSADYFAEICRLVTDNKTKKHHISVEVAPPDDDSYIQKLFDAGATALIINIEVANECKRKKICPGKSAISIERYMAAFEKAVSIFGRGKVSSVIIVGIQKESDIIGICEKIIPMGVIPTIIPFKPLDACKMKSHEKANPDEVLRISSRVSELLSDEVLYVYGHGGCTKCGGCSLESVFQLSNKAGLRKENAG
ncbi:MAG: radical SAM protein [Defluviitaleaceae bacterium]|nr:radical SAM protein [Defluviitaleaceae bacterium]